MHNAVEGHRMEFTQRRPSSDLARLIGTPGGVSTLR